LAADERRSGARRKGDGEVREESTEKRTVPSFGFTERGRAASPGCPEERPGVKNGPEAHVEAVRCILIASRELKMEIPVLSTRQHIGTG
jgi:hypothetical protein